MSSPSATPPAHGPHAGSAAEAAAVQPHATPRSRSTREALPLPPDPYPGLRPFTQNESRLFCGRVMERLRLLKLLAGSDFVAVLGSSGSGKSSLVLSGLLPDIRSGKLPGSPAAGIEFATFRPGRNPYAHLAAALFKTTLGSGLPDSLVIEEHLRSGPLALASIFEVRARWDQEAATLDRRLLEMRLRMLEVEVAPPAAPATLTATATAFSLSAENSPAEAAATPPVPAAKAETEHEKDKQRLLTLKAQLTEQLSHLTAAAPPQFDPPQILASSSVPASATAAPPPPSLLIVVDQFEEIFRFANLVAKEQDEDSATRRDFRPVAGELDEAQAFITLLLAAARESAGRVRVVITMRSDFFKHCEVFEGLPEAIAAHQFITPRMSRDQMEDAIQMPLDHFHSAISEDLVNQILNDVHGEFDQLPVLQHALARMWHQARAQRPPQPAELTAADYHHAERLSGAMNAHGDELITNNQFIPDQVARFFRCLGDFDPTSGHAIRRPRTLAQISAESGLNAGAVCRIATAFAHPEASFITAAPALLAETELWQVLDQAAAVFEQPAPALPASPPSAPSSTLAPASPPPTPTPEKPTRAIDDAWTQLLAEATLKLPAPDAPGGATPPSAGQKLIQLLRADLAASAAAPSQKTQATRSDTPPPPPTVPKAIGDIVIDLTHECLLRKWQAYTDWMRSEKREGDALKNLKQRMDEFDWEITPTTRRDHLTSGQYLRFTEILSDIARRPQPWGARYACDLPKTQRFLFAEKRYDRIRRWRWPLIGAAFLLIIAVAGVWVSYANAQTAEINEQAALAKALANSTLAETETKRAEAESKAASEAKGREDAEAQIAAIKEQLNKISSGQSAAQNNTVSENGELKSKLNDVGGLVTTLLADAGLDHEKLPESIRKKVKDLGFTPHLNSDSVKKMATRISLSSSRKIDGFSVSLLSVALLPDPHDTAPYQYRLLASGTEGLWRLTLGDSREEDPARPDLPVEKPSLPEKILTQEDTILSVSTQTDSDGWVLTTNSGSDIGLSKDGGKKWISIKTPSNYVTCARMIAGQRIAYGTMAGELGLIDASNDEPKVGALLPSLHNGTISDVAVSPVRPEGTLLIASRNDRSASLWSIQNDLTLKPIDLGEYGRAGGPVIGASFSPDGRWLLLPSVEKTIRLCLLHTQGDATRVLNSITLTHENPVVGGSFSPDGRWIATADIYGKVYIWRSIPVPLAEGDSLPSGIFTGHTRSISALAWAPNSAGLATADQTGAVIVWRLQVGATVSGVPLIMPIATKGVNALAWSPDSSLLATASKEGAAQVHPIAFSALSAYEIQTGAEDSADVLYLPASEWPSDFDDVTFLRTTQVRITNPVTRSSIMARVDARENDKQEGLLISKSVATRLDLKPGAELEIAVSKLLTRQQMPDDLTRLKVARLIFDQQAFRDGKGQASIQHVKNSSHLVYAGVSAVTRPQLFSWLKTLLDEGMQTKADAIVLDYFANTTDIVDRWTEVPSGTQNDSAAQVPYDALHFYLRWMVAYFGSTATIKIVQKALNDPTDGIMGDTTKTKLMQSSLNDLAELLNKLDKTSPSMIEGLAPVLEDPLVFAITKREALTFAKTFLSPITTSAADQRLIDRARSAIGKGTQYKLGEGGMDPAAPHPAAKNGKCDSSGFIAWVLGKSRNTTNPFYLKGSDVGGWMDVTNMQRDIAEPGGFLSQVTQPYPGCIAAYGSGRDTARNIALITEVTTDKDGRTIPAKLINCSTDNWTQHQDAIQEIPADGFLSNPTTIYGRYDPTQP